MVDEHWINGYPTPISNPMTPYPQYRAQRKLWGINALGSVVVEVESENGTVGVGMLCDTRYIFLVASFRFHQVFQLEDHLLVI